MLTASAEAGLEQGPDEHLTGARSTGATDRGVGALDSTCTMLDLQPA